MMDIHQVNSKETMLNENDIVIVAAHMSEPTQEIKDAAKQHGVSAERLFYTIYLQQMQEPSLIRIREANTLFTITALENRTGFVFMYNGDTKENVANNFLEFLKAAYTMGFNILAVQCVDDSLNNVAEQVEGSVKDAELTYVEDKDLLCVQFSQPHGD
jgi:hypothetical protein